MSPTVATESVFLMAAMAAAKGRHIRSSDVLDAFLHTETDEDVLMVLKGVLAEMMVRIAPEVYGKYITKDSKGNAIIYDRLKKALYGLLCLSLIIYRKFRKEIEEYGFKVNPYDPCIANKDVEVAKLNEGGSQVIGPNNKPVMETV